MIPSRIHQNQPRSSPVEEIYQTISFTRYSSTYQSDMGIEYIVETSSDRRTWVSNNTIVGSAVDIGGGMERVVFRSNTANSAGSTQFIRVRVKAK